MYIMFATGKFWFEVPETIKFNIEGSLPDYTYAKDVVINTIGQIGADGATYEVCQFVCETTRNISVPDRMVICNMAIEMSGKEGLVKPDQKLVTMLARPNKSYEIIKGDEGAAALKIIDICRSSISTYWKN